MVISIRKGVSMTKGNHKQSCHKESCCNNPKEDCCKEHTCQCNYHQQTKNQSQPDLLAELTDTLQRLQAEFENYRKRSERECAEFKQYANRQFIEDLLPLLDNFALALKAVPDEGFKLIYTQFFDLLSRYGLKPISCDGKFNPKFHEALLQEQSEKESGTILEELQKGYIVGDAVLRPARVKIAWKPLNEKTSKASA